LSIRSQKDNRALAGKKSANSADPALMTANSMLSAL
jgi:hypothetical protein